MAQIPAIIDRVNYVKTITEDPCNGPPWIISLDLALPPAGDAVITMMLFGWDDVARGFLRPRGLHRGRGARRGPRVTGRLRRLGRALGRLPGIGDDPGDFIGKRLPFAKLVKGRKFGLGEKLLWLVDNRFQQVLFWWLVIDVVEGFWYDWTSLMMASEFCNRAFEAALYMTGPGGSFPALGAWRGTFHDDFRWQEGGLAGVTAGVNLPAGTWRVTSALLARNVGANAAFFGLRLNAGGAGGEIYDEVRSGLVPPLLVTEAVTSAVIEGPGLVFVMANAFISSFAGEEIHTTVQGSSPGFQAPDLPPCERL